MILYSIAIRFYHFIVRLLTPFNSKAALFTRGRSETFDILSKQLKPKKYRRVWIHCASLGEFEQGRPVIEKLKRENKNIEIVLTFFSPSGYEPQKNYSQADVICYLPADTKRNAEKFIEQINPDLAIFVKYEFWLNFLNRLHHKKIPTLLISGIFRRDQHFFKWYGKIFRRTLFYYDHLFLQNNESMEILSEIGLKNCTKAGDTRFDRVLEISSQPKNFDEIKQFKAEAFCFICGSSWPEDEKFILTALSKTEHKNIKLIFAPHNIEDIHINQISSVIKTYAPNLKYKVYTKWNKTEEADILVLDTMGMLSSVYQYADLAYVGGGFGNGIHNILEAAVFGIPVIFGPNYRKFQEANDSIEKGIAFSYAAEHELMDLLNKLIRNTELLGDISKKCRSYFSENSGSSDLILAYIKNHFLDPHFSQFSPPNG